MSKPTLLDMVQTILSDMDSDEVNSINDTVEAAQVANILRTVYRNMMANRNWPHQRKLLTLQASGDADLPTHMVVQENIKEMVSVRYNKIKLGQTKRYYDEVRWVEPDDFLRHVDMRDSTASYVISVTDPSGIALLIANNNSPTYYTSFDDTTLVFDSYDASVDDTLQASKIQAMAYVTPGWVNDDDAIPDLPEEAFPALIEEATSRAFALLKQQPNQISAVEAKRQQAWLARKAWRVAGGVKYPNYGRGRSKYHRDPTFTRDDY